MAVVYQRPLPYLYLARQVFGARELPWQAFDALPLAAEPYAAALDLVVTFALSDYTRAAGIALLRAPQFKFEIDGHEPTLAEIAACDAELRDIQFLGGRDRLHALLDEWRAEGTPSVRKGERRGRSHANADPRPRRARRGRRRPRVPRRGRAAFRSSRHAAALPRHLRAASSRERGRCLRGGECAAARRARRMLR